MKENHWSMAEGNQRQQNQINQRWINGRTIERTLSTLVVVTNITLALILI
jgi:hypothetical protein